MVGKISLEWGSNGGLENENKCLFLESKHKESKRGPVAKFYTHSFQKVKVSQDWEKRPLKF